MFVRNNLDVQKGEEYSHKLKVLTRKYFASKLKFIRSVYRSALDIFRESGEGGGGVKSVARTSCKRLK